MHIYARHEAMRGNVSHLCTSRPQPPFAHAAQIHPPQRHVDLAAQPKEQKLNRNRTKHEIALTLNVSLSEAMFFLLAVVGHKISVPRNDPFCSPFVP